MLVGTGEIPWILSIMRVVDLRSLQGKEFYRQLRPPMFDGDILENRSMLLHMA